MGQTRPGIFVPGLFGGWLEGQNAFQTRSFQDVLFLQPHTFAKPFLMPKKLDRIQLGSSLLAMMAPSERGCPKTREKVENL